MQNQAVLKWVSRTTHHILTRLSTERNEIVPPDATVLHEAEPCQQPLSEKEGDKHAYACMRGRCYRDSCSAALGRGPCAFPSPRADLLGPEDPLTR